MYTSGYPTIPKVPNEFFLYSDTVVCFVVCYILNQCVNNFMNSVAAFVSEQCLN
jgi:hypothetical protein